MKPALLLMVLSCAEVIPAQDRQKHIGEIEFFGESIETPPSERVSDTHQLLFFHYYKEFSEIEGEVRT
jgi:hypothetical protein